MSWCRDGFNELLEHCISASDLAASITDRNITTSSACSGINSDGMADRIVSCTAVEIARKNHLTGSPLKFTALFAIEKNVACQEELLSQEGGPMHVFGDMMDFTPSHLRKDVGLDGGQELEPEELAKILPRCDVKTEAWCYRHGKMCSLQRADIHRAGTPCTPHSSFGAGRQWSDPTVKVFFIWCAHRRKLMEQLVFHENVPQMGDGTARAHLGDIYIIICLKLDSEDFGWPYSRRRQILAMVLKAWIFFVLHDDIGWVDNPEQLIIDALNIEGFISGVFFPQVRISFE